MQFKNILPVLAACGIIASCGTGKQLAQAEKTNDDLRASNARLQELVKTCGAEMAGLQEANRALALKAMECAATEASIRRNLELLNEKLAEQGTSLRDIREKVGEALHTFHEADADVYYRDGFLLISMNDRLLFGSGSTQLKPEGAAALEVIGRVMNDYPRIRAIVVGNTDDRPVGAKFTDNWSLSTERANAVIRLLRDKYAVDPHRLTAAGRGKYNPVADNGTPGGQAANRRIEIVINPDLAGLWETAGE